MKSLFKKIWSTKLVWLYILTMIVAFTPRYGKITVGYKEPLLVGGLWVAVAGIRLLCRKHRADVVQMKNLGFFLCIYLIPHVITHLYTVVLMLLGKVEWKYLTSNATVYIPVLIVLSAVYLFGAKALRYTLIAMIGAFVLSMVCSVILIGPHIIPDAIIQAYFDQNHAKNYLELHDIVLAIGYVMVYYLYRGRKLERRDIAFLVCAVSIGVLGMKRIVVLALLACLAFAALVYILPKKARYAVCVIGGFGILIGCFGFLWLMSEGDLFFNLMEKFHINTMGRIYYYRDVMALSDFHILYPGLGRNVVTQLLTTEMSYLRVAGVHSDIIKMYVENGFVMYGLWSGYHLLAVPAMLRKRFGDKVAVMGFAVTMYSFLLYLTDNIEVYFVCQILAMMIPMCFALRESSSLNVNEKTLVDGEEQK